jgi:hypothetical protein
MKFAPTVYVLCGNIEDGFVCVFTKKQMSSALSNQVAMLKTGPDNSPGYAFSLVEPGAGKLTLVFRKYQAECDISQTQ